jgi:adenine-specific DNA-methyltransferase
VCRIGDRGLAVSAPRLELTWPNKDKFLLAPRNDEGKPVWVERQHPAAVEVRATEITDEVGEVNSDNPYADNLLFVGDSLDVLRVLSEVPEYRREYRGRVRLAYWDPPFNTGQAFAHYDDWMEHSTWLSFMCDRLAAVRDLLSSDGSLWMHLDDAEVHRMRCLLDEVFGQDCFVSEVSWRAADSSNNDAQAFSNDHNTILIYSKRPGWKSRRLPRTAQSNAHYRNPDDDPRGPWFAGNVSSPNPRPNLTYAIDESFGWQGTPIPPPANGWRWDKSLVREKIASGEIVLSESEPGRPRLMRKTYLSEQEGLAPSSVWADLEETGHNRQAKYELKRLFPGVPTADLFATPKPERLLRKVLMVATEPGDVVLDVFGGSGTTAAVAHKMGRRWILAELSPDTVRQFICPRLRSVVEGTDDGGVSQEEIAEPVESLPEGLRPADVAQARKTLSDLADDGSLASLSDDAVSEVLRALKRLSRTRKHTVRHAEQGGGFRVVTVLPSMYEVSDYGVLLSAQATNGRFARAVAGQLGFEWQSKKDTPFCGIRGRMRLAVLDGAVGEEEVRHIVSCLEPGQRVTIVAKLILPGAEETLHDISRGSRLRKAPDDLLHPRSRQARRTLAGVL